MRHLFCCLFFLIFFIKGEKSAIEIVRYELGNWECSKSIKLEKGFLLFDPCKWGKEKPKRIMRKDIVDLLLTINENEIRRVSLLKRPKSSGCAVSKYSYAFIFGTRSYDINEYLCPNDKDFRLITQLNKMFSSLEE
jgi:hypothetical protein